MPFVFLLLVVSNARISSLPECSERPPEVSPLDSMPLHMAWVITRRADFSPSGGVCPAGTTAA
eukprot:CAMPEP_0175758922 /NCGR_PEP_ID=MMETSP0097-20121207/65279_1 /TAXON_ID=311494 /ORGANISM="Alexandrium monilatum, Strain CCMP3105" /LENGTH=62 /DNA_ID=CAMNT_0017068251 /DNA_START=15 /DNA_END=200 /DNA_ORIENTATION=-